MWLCRAHERLPSATLQTRTFAVRPVGIISLDGRLRENAISAKKYSVSEEKMCLHQVPDAVGPALEMPIHGRRLGLAYAAFAPCNIVSRKSLRSVTAKPQAGHSEAIV